MDIVYLADHPDLVPELARLHFAQWGRYRPDEPLQDRTRRLAAECGRGGVPSVFVALADGEAPLEGARVLGSAMLVAHDMDTRRDLAPWLAGVLVVDAHRHRGLGSALVARVEAEAAASGIERLYLYTPDRMSFYARLGWEAQETCEYLGQQVTIMAKHLG